MKTKCQPDVGGPSPKCGHAIFDRLVDVPRGTARRGQATAVAAAGLSSMFFFGRSPVMVEVHA
jgi:hypothetical protein